VRIAVVVPFRNAERFAARCLGALVAQERFGGEVEVVAVDDRSTDRSAEIAGRFPSVRLVRSPGHGPYAARNAGVAATSGDVVALTDADCEPAPDWLRRIGAAFERPTTALLVGPRLPAHDSFGLALLSAYELAKDDFVFGGGRADLYYASANNMAVRRSVLEALGGFEERRRGADTLLVRRVVERHSAAAVRYEPALRVRHLEIAHVRDYYRKSFSYGRSMGALHGAFGRQLGPRERVAVWRRTVAREGYTAPRAAALLAALGGGAAFWALGGLSAGLPRGRR
jgi:glycosyltransferase involved in cell wall biosynthesis